MKLSRTEDQRLIESSALDWLGAHCGFRERAAGVHRDGGHAPRWRAFAELGWLGMPLAEAHGGLGLGAFECGLLMQALGRHLVVEPVQACVHEAAALLQAAGSPAQRARWLPGVAAGEHRLALAHAETPHGAPDQTPRLRATPTASGWRLDGAKRAVRAGPGAVRWIVSAATPEGVLRLFLLSPDAPGLRVLAHDTPDGGRAADALFDGVAVPPEDLLGPADAPAEDLLRESLARAELMRCWEACGALQAMAEQTAAYVQQRQQFGRPLAQFQVVQHRLAEMAVHATEALAACELATLRLARGDDAPDAAALARIQVSTAAQFIAKEAVQLHGAMGVCEELPIAAGFRQLLAFTHAEASAAALAARRGRALLASRAHELSQTL